MFFIYGTDHYRVSQKLQEIKNGFRQKRDQTGLNTIALDGVDLSPDQLRQEALTMPFLGEKKIIIIKDCWRNQNHREAIADWLKTNSQRIDNVICFVDFIDSTKAGSGRRGKITPSDELFKYLAKQEYVWKLNLLTGRELTVWLKKYLTKQAITLEPAAASELIARSGNDLFQLTNELRKLTAYRNGQPITVTNVRDLATSGLDDNIFNLINSLGQKNRPLALKLIANQISAGNHPLTVVTMVARQFKIMLRLKSGGATAAQLGLPPFAWDKAKIQAKNFPVDQLKKILNEIMELERQLKSGGGSELLFDIFIAKNC